MELIYVYKNTIVITIKDKTHFIGTKGYNIKVLKKYWIMNDYI